MLNILTNLKLKWQNLKQREKILLIIVVALGVVYASCVFYFKPQYARLIQLRQELAETRKTYQVALAEGWNDIPGLQREIARVQEELTALGTEVPSYKSTPAVLVDLYQLAVKYDLQLNGENNRKIVFGKLENHGDYSSYNIDMELTGMSSDVYGFLYDVQQMGRIMAVDRGEIWSEIPGYLRCSLTLKVFVLGDVEDDPPTYPFMGFEQTMMEPYRMFTPSTLAPRTDDSSPDLSALPAEDVEPVPESHPKSNTVIPPRKDLAYLEDETVDPSWEFDIVH